MSLVALPFASPDPSLSFNWIKKRPLSHNQNELVVEKVTRNHCEGYYTCEILKHGKSFFSTYHCLRVAGKQTSAFFVLSCECESAYLGDTLISTNVKLFDDVGQATMELRSDWYSLGIELDIEYATRKVRSGLCIAQHIQGCRQPLIFGGAILCVTLKCPTCSLLESSEAILPKIFF